MDMLLSRSALGFNWLAHDFSQSLLHLSMQNEVPERTIDLQTTGFPSVLSCASEGDRR